MMMKPSSFIRIATVLMAALLVPGPAFIWADPASDAVNSSSGAGGSPVVAANPDQLDSLVAPIALYPDPLISQILVASTYPLELVQAAQWLEQHPDLKG